MVVDVAWSADVTLVVQLVQRRIAKARRLTIAAIVVVTFVIGQLIRRSVMVLVVVAVRVLTLVCIVGGDGVIDDV